MMNPKYPIYIVSKGRWESRLTSKALEFRNIPYKIVIEPNEYENYASVIDKDKILITNFNDLGRASIPARNWIFNHAISEGYERHWILDDNIRSFIYLNKNKKYYTTCGTSFRIIEDFVDRYKNIAFAGMQYNGFVPAKQKFNPISINSRVYSCTLVNTKIPYRWRGIYNEDTDICLRALKDGWCTILFNTYLCDKIRTMTIKGGNTGYYQKEENKKIDGRYLMAKSLQEQHPDVTNIVWKWGRWQHKVNYRKFKNNKLKYKDDIKIEKIDYKMNKLIEIGKNNYANKSKT